MSATLAPPLFLQLMNPNNTGAPAVGFQVFTYLAGTSTKQATWTDSTQGTPNSNPLQLDALGGANVWGDPTLAYKFVWAPANDTDPPTSPIRTVDNLYFPLSLAALTQAVLGTILYPRTSTEIAASVTPTSFVYPAGHAFRYGMVGDGAFGASTGTDNTAAFNSLTAVCSKGEPGYIPAGIYRFASRPNVIGNTCTIRGSSKGWVSLLRDYTESTPTNGFITANGGALFLDNIYVLANTGKTGGAGVSLIGQANGAAPDYSRLSGLYISGVGGTGTWNYALLADGSARLSPLGLRDLAVQGCSFFAATTDIAAFVSCNNTLVDAAFFPAGGSATTVRITGVSGNLTNNFSLRTSFVQDLVMDWTTYAQVFASVGIGNINNTSNVSNSTVFAPQITGTVQAFWTNSTAITNSIPSGQTKGTFTLTLATGCTTTPTVTCAWEKMGDLVMLRIPGIAATSNATGMTFTGVPAAIQPGSTQYAPVTDFSDNGSGGLYGGMQVTNSGTLTALLAATNLVTNKVELSPVAFTNSGTKGLGQSAGNVTLSYTLN